MVLRGAAERALLYLTSVNGDGTLFNVSCQPTTPCAHTRCSPCHLAQSHECDRIMNLQTVLASVNAETQRFLSEYARRVLARMDMDSDEEEDDADL